MFHRFPLNIFISLRCRGISLQQIQTAVKPIHPCIISRNDIGISERRNVLIPDLSPTTTQFNRTQYILIPIFIKLLLIYTPTQRKRWKCPPTVARCKFRGTVGSDTDSRQIAVCIVVIYTPKIRNQIVFITTTRRSSLFRPGSHDLESIGIARRIQPFCRKRTTGIGFPRETCHRRNRMFSKLIIITQRILKCIIQFRRTRIGDTVFQQKFTLHIRTHIIWSIIRPQIKKRVKLGIGIFR